MADRPLDRCATVSRKGPTGSAGPFFPSTSFASTGSTICRPQNPITALGFYTPPRRSRLTNKMCGRDHLSSPSCEQRPEILECRSGISRAAAKSLGDYNDGKADVRCRAGQIILSCRRAGSGKAPSCQRVTRSRTSPFCPSADARRRAWRHAGPDGRDAPGRPGFPARAA